jgi:hypothetical protein
VGTISTNPRYVAGTLAIMTTDGSTTPSRNIRMSDDLWNRLGDVAAGTGTSRAKILGELTRWYLDDMGKLAMPKLPIPSRHPAE